MRKSRRSGVVSGITLITIGLLLFWMNRADNLTDGLVFFVVGSVFLGAYLYSRNYGLLIPAWTRRIDGYRFHVSIEPPLEPIRTGNFDEDVRTNAQRLLTLFEAQLREDPGQWAVLEPIFTPATGETESSVR